MTLSQSIPIKSAQKETLQIHFQYIFAAKTFPMHQLLLHEEKKKKISFFMIII